METNNGDTIHGKRKYYAIVVLAGGCLLSSSILCGIGKISGAEYNAGLTTTSLMVMAYFGANAAQKFSPNGGK